MCKDQNPVSKRNFLVTFDIKVIYKYKRGCRADEPKAGHERTMSLPYSYIALATFFSNHGAEIS